MRSAWFAMLVACSGSASDRDREPTLEPIIGTRSEEGGALTPTFEIDDAFGRYIGCDLRFDNVPSDARIELVWIFQPAGETAPARVLHQAWYRADKRREPLRAWVDQVAEPNTARNARGTYECVWTLGRRGISARLTVRAKA